MAVASAIDLARRLLQLLVDGELHASAILANQLQESPAAVAIAAQELRDVGIDVQAAASGGLQLARAVELLDPARIRAAMRASRLGQLHDLEVVFEVDSTNTRLLAAAPPQVGGAAVCLAEIQRAGRGRLGRRWLSPFGCGVALSLGWTCRDGTRTLPALSLGVGVAVARALARVEAVGVSLKWPNDIVWRDRKIGGVLVEVRAATDGPVHLVIGVGVNVSMPAEVCRELALVGADAAAVAEACGKPVSRNSVAAAILDELLSMLSDFERLGFAAYRDAWMALDALNGRDVLVSVGAESVSGIARGVDMDGALLLETAERTHRVVSGEATLRLAGE